MSCEPNGLVVVVVVVVVGLVVAMGERPAFPLVVGQQSDQQVCFPCSAILTVMQITLSLDSAVCASHLLEQITIHTGEMGTKSGPICFGSHPLGAPDEPNVSSSL